MLILPPIPQIFYDTFQQYTIETYGLRGSITGTVDLTGQYSLIGTTQAFFRATDEFGEPYSGIGIDAEDNIETQDRFKVPITYDIRDRDYIRMRIEPGGNTDLALAWWVVKGGTKNLSLMFNLKKFYARRTTAVPAAVLGLVLPT